MAAHTGVLTLQQITGLHQCSIVSTVTTDPGTGMMLCEEMFIDGRMEDLYFECSALLNEAN